MLRWPLFPPLPLDAVTPESGGVRRPTSERCLDASKAACLMVFFDGAAYPKADGAIRVPIIFDNLIAKREMPVTVAVFVDPGVIKGGSLEAKAGTLHLQLVAAKSDGCRE